MLKVTPPPNLQLAIKSLGTLDAGVLQAAGKGLARGLHYAMGIAQTQFLQGPRPARLGEVTGRLRNSIATDVQVSAERVRGRIGSTVPYAAFHEFGFTGAIRVKEHQRTQKVTSRATGADLGEIRRPIKDRDGNVVGYKNTKSSAVKVVKDRLGLEKFNESFAVVGGLVKAHTRHLSYKGKPFVRPAVFKAQPVILAAIREELAKLGGPGSQPSTPQPST